MVTIEINGKTWDLPSRLVEMNLDYLIRIRTTECETGIDFMTKVCKIPKKELRKVNELEINNFVNQYVELIGSINKLSENLEYVESVTIARKKYEVPKTLLTSTFGQWEDFNMILRKHDEFEAYPYILAIFLQKNYDGERVEKLARQCRKINVVTAVKIITFFLQIEPRFLRNLLQYTKGWMIVENYVQVQELLMTDGATITT